MTREVTSGASMRNIPTHSANCLRFRARGCLSDMFPAISRLILQQKITPGGIVYEQIFQVPLVLLYTTESPAATPMQNQKYRSPPT